VAFRDSPTHNEAAREIRRTSWTHINCYTAEAASRSPNLSHPARKMLSVRVSQVRERRSRERSPAFGASPLSAHGVE
jgi:hypothetical protein